MTKRKTKTDIEALKGQIVDFIKGLDTDPLAIQLLSDHVALYKPKVDINKKFKLKKLGPLQIQDNTVLHLLNKYGYESSFSFHEQVKKEWDHSNFLKKHLSDTYIKCSYVSRQKMEFQKLINIDRVLKRLSKKKLVDGGTKKEPYLLTGDGKIYLQQVKSFLTESAEAMVSDDPRLRDLSKFLIGEEEDGE